MHGPVCYFELVDIFNGAPSGTRGQGAASCPSEGEDEAAN